MHRIFFTDYEVFGLERNIDLERFYLYKCLAYIPFLLIDGTYMILNKISILDEIAVYDNSFNDFNNFIKFLKKYKNDFFVTSEDILLMDYVFKSSFVSDEIKKNIKLLDDFLKIEKGNKSYYEAQLKYCNFYLLYSEDKSDKK